MADTEVKGYYTIGGELYPRVTHVLNILDKPGLARWRGKVGNFEADRISSEAASLGTAFHEVAADINRGSHMKRGWQPPGHFREMSFAYIDWLHQNIGQILEVEKLAVSEELKYAGTMDLLAILKGDSSPSIIDVKTSNSVSPDWPLQLSAYKLAVEEEMGIQIARRVIIRVPKTGVCTPETYIYEDHDADEAIWKRCLEIWRWAQEDKLRHKKAKGFKLAL